MAGPVEPGDGHTWCGVGTAYPNDLMAGEYHLKGHGGGWRATAT